MLDLAGRTIVVTGIASGIGLATGRFLIGSGARVIGLDRNMPELPVAPAAFHSIDLSQPSSVMHAVEMISGLIDGLANIAGVSSAVPYEQQFRVNYLGTRLLTEALLPRLSESASVVSIASGTALQWRERIGIFRELAETTGFEAGLSWLSAHPQNGPHSYGRAKEALIVWSQIMAARAIGTGRRFNTISPGPVETPMLSEFKSSIGEAVINADIARANRAGDANDIAAAIGYLLSSTSSWVNGADIPVDGGWAASALLDNVKWPPDPE